MKTLSIFVALISFFTFSAMQMLHIRTDLRQYCQSLEEDFALISPERKAQLEQITAYIKEKLAQKESAKLVFICTHNSRRSQFAQVWANVASQYYGYPPAQIQIFSGGTETTACNARTIAALERAGVQARKVNELNPSVLTAQNPRYEVVLNLGKPKQFLYLFSKKYNEESNPQNNFCAVLVCSQADNACPAVMGAEKRIYHGFEDPKRADNTPDESAVYDATCREIAREMFYIFRQLKA